MQFCNFSIMELVMSVARLPVIVGFGGFNAAGRSSGHHAYRRMVIESLQSQERQETIAGLAVMMGLVGFADDAYRNAEGKPLSLDDIEACFGEQVLDGTLIRRIDKTFFDVDATHWQKSATLGAGDSPLVVEMRKRDLPEPVPS